MKKLFKRLYKTPTFRKVICWLIPQYIRLVHYTCRQKIVMPPETLPYMSGEKNAIFAFWHGRLLMMAMLCPPKRKMNILISTHGDGEIIARAMHNFGFGTVRGSSTRGGAGAAMRSLTVLEAGENIVITPDGPRGPEMRVQPGIITIAQMTGLPVIFGAFSASRYKHMRSWDRFLLAKPFGCIHYEVSAPMFNVTAESLEVIMRKQIEEVDSKV